MTKKFLILTMGLLCAWPVMADNVKGLTIEYSVATEYDEEGNVTNYETLNFIDAISYIGIISHGNGIDIIFRDPKAGSIHLDNFSSIVLGDVEETTCYSYGKTDTPTPVANVERKVTITAYPNPAADHVRIEGVAEGETIRLFAADGKLVYMGQNTEIDLSGMASGIYILQAGKSFAKIIKQ